MKICPKCNIKEQLPYNGYCRDCANKAKIKFAQKRKALVMRYKTFKGCVTCGYNKSPHALQFDHVIPILRDSTNVKSLRYEGKINYTWSVKKIKLYLQDVQVLCANCHAIKSQKESSERSKKYWKDKR